MKRMNYFEELEKRDIIKYCSNAQELISRTNKTQLMILIEYRTLIIVEV
jgi:hypothetical protein